MPDDGRQASTASSSSARPAHAATSGISFGHSTTTNSSSSSTAGNAPPGHFLRRARTVDEPSMRSASMSRHMSSDSSSAEAPPRRSSNFSEYSLSEARDILNPRPYPQGEQVSSHEASPLASLSLAFALLPAIAGILFQNGTSVVTDIMLLGLAAIFLHWSVTQPWQWYHAAQEVRVLEEHSMSTSSLETDSGLDSATKSPNGNAPLDDVPEEQEASGQDDSSSEKKEARMEQMTAQQQAALRELYRHENLALLSCFLMPMLSAYLLHYIRGQLTRPSEGLVSNFNLTIFIMVAELRVLSHIITLVQSRTLHLQRIVQDSPLGRQQAGTETLLQEMLKRLDRLEGLSTSQSNTLAGHGESLSSTTATVSRDVRNTIQPELDALNRAVRRYEKKATLLQLQTESRFTQMHARLDDAISLAAAAAKTSNGRQSLLPWIWNMIVAAVTFPFKAVLEILALPLKPIVAFANRNKHTSSTLRPPRSRSGKLPASVKYNGDRVPTRIIKR
ncbi:hypothetical protein BBK36DRAFT_1124039 [Trichoderma citrinoviride]|uniref:Uncharacterized protein n=1 Tax=Trichoderma citrinoviride TaxID=58853 RepID=A0A2T4B4T8_9HYPO|nr:hypothetical protein BBK36DRAFT_1124039 [Trichoderma citrinoviride]PTB64345.1 hypothetical protein BBK36DRAFT_1124039 [Trichoderma citrinoviride]